MTTERREDLRAPVSLLAMVHGSDGDAVPVMLLDLSSYGTRIQTDAEPAEGTEYHLRFSAHGKDYETRFQVMRCLDANDSSYHWGCSFLDASPEIMAELRDALAGVSKSNTGLRDWAAVEADLESGRSDIVVVGHTPDGKEITVSRQECLDVGREGIHLLVETLANLQAG